MRRGTSKSFRASGPWCRWSKKARSSPTPNWRYWTLPSKRTSTPRPRRGEVVAKYRFMLDPTKKPAAIDFTALIGKDKEKATELGIYTFEKDQLKISVAETGKLRPGVFEGKGTENCSVIVLKKIR